MPIKNIKQGFVLIEMIVYTALFTIIMGGLVVTAYQLSESTTELEGRTAVQEELNFVTRKIEWTLAGAEDIHFTASDEVKIDNNNLTPNHYVFKLNDPDPDHRSHYITLNGEDLTTDNVNVEELIFDDISTPGYPEGLNIVLTINGQTLSLNKYLRI